MEKSLKSAPGGKASADKKKSRITYLIDNPFCQIRWPDIETKSDQDLILELLCTFLSPIGNHRRLHISPATSKGKRSKKQARATRKKAQLGSHQEENYQELDSKNSVDRTGTILNLPIASTITTTTTTTTTTTNVSANLGERTSSDIPTPPEINQHILIGLNSISSALTTLASSRLPQSFLPSLTLHCPKRKRKAPDLNPAANAATHPSMPYLTAIFLTRADSQPTPLHAHLPMLTYLSSLPTHPYPTLLIPLPKGAAAKLQQALAIPSANFIGLWSTLPEVGTGGRLLELVRRVVPPVDVPWLEGKLREDTGEGDKEPEEGEETKGLNQAEYQPLRIKRLNTTIGLVKQRVV